MIKHRLPETRGHFNFGWIDSYRTFSNNTYNDPNYTNFSDLEVINDDRVQPKSFTPIHQHNDMEIIGYVVKGPCFHNDNIMNTVEVPSGGVQRMSCGTGIWHCEGNPSDEPIHYLQLWMRAARHNFPPKYDVWMFDREEKLDNFCPIASSEGPLVIQSYAKLNAGIFTKDHTEQLDINRRYYLYIINGSAIINNIEAYTGSGFSFENESELIITNPEEEPEMLLFDLR